MNQLCSKNEKYFVQLQYDCNVVLYSIDAGTYKLLWTTNTRRGSRSRCISARFELQKGDGNLVLYSSTGEVLWAVHKHGGPGGDRLVMQADGNLVLYDGGKTIWESGTAGPR